MIPNRKYTHHISQGKGKALVSCQKMQISSPIHVLIWRTILLLPKLTWAMMIYHWLFTKISTLTNQDLTTEERKIMRFIGQMRPAVQALSSGNSTIHQHKLINARMILVGTHCIQTIWSWKQHPTQEKILNVTIEVKRQDKYRSLHYRLTSK